MEPLTQTWHFPPSALSLLCFKRRRTSRDSISIFKVVSYCHIKPALKHISLASSFETLEVDWTCWASVPKDISQSHFRVTLYGQSVFRHTGYSFHQKYFADKHVTTKHLYKCWMNVNFVAHFAVFHFKLMIGVDSVLTLQDCNCIHLYLVFSPRQHKRLLWHSYAVKNSANQFQRVQRLAFHLKLNHRRTSGPVVHHRVLHAINVFVQHEKKKMIRCLYFVIQGHCTNKSLF